MQTVSRKQKVESPPNKRSSVRRAERSLVLRDKATFLQALNLLEELSLSQAITYQPIARPSVNSIQADEELSYSDEIIYSIVMPTRYFTDSVAFLESNGIVGEEWEVVPLSELSPEQQARLRGFRGSPSR